MQLTDGYKHDFKMKNPIDFRRCGKQKVGMYSVEITANRVRLRYRDKSSIISSYFRATNSTREIKQNIYEDIFEELEK